MEFSKRFFRRAEEARAARAVARAAVAGYCFARNLPFDEAARGKSSNPGE
jgi:hypothetical protein